MLASGVQQSDSVTHVSILFQILFPFNLLQSIQQSSLSYTVGPRWLSILNVAVCTCQSQTFNISLIIRHFKSVLEVNRMYGLLMITY